MSTNRPLISIVVPTKNRYKYLYHLIALVAKLHSDDVELLIQDNTEDNTEFYSFLLEHNIGFINYHHKPESISMTENCDLAISNSRGEYICFLGDDDGFCCGIIDAVRYMKDNKIDNLLSSKTFYNWPDFYDPSIFNLSSTLEFEKGKGLFETVKPLEELKKCVNNGFDGLYKMPHAYQALISRHVMDMVWDKYSSFFPGPSPDMANAVALSLLNITCVYWDSPLVFSGQSRSVGGGERLLNSNNLKKLTEVPIMPKDVLDNWDQRIPKYWCADSIWPQSAIQALQGNPDFSVNYEKILARFVFYHPLYFQECKSLATSVLRLYICFFFLFIRKIYTFTFYRFTYYLNKGKKLGHSSIIRNIHDISNAVDQLNELRPFNTKSGYVK